MQDIFWGKKGFAFLLCFVVQNVLVFAQTFTQKANQNPAAQWAEVAFARNTEPQNNSIRANRVFIQFRQGAEIPPQAASRWLRHRYGLSEDITWQQIGQQTDPMGIVHERYQQTYKGMPVEGGICILHIDKGRVIALNGSIEPTPALDMQPTIPFLSEEQARSKALSQINATHYRWQSPEQEAHLKQEQNRPDASYFPKAKLVYARPIQNENAEMRLCYKFDIYAETPLRRADVLIDAQNGQSIAIMDKLCTGNSNGTAVTKYSGTRSIVTDSLSPSSYRLRETSRGGGIFTYDNNHQTGFVNNDFTDADNFWNNVNSNQDEAATDAHWGAEMTYDYYQNIHGRASIDNNNMPVRSYVHYGTNYVNAFWDGDRMAYGDGSGTVTALTCLDIAGHEMTHGVTQFTAGLNYVNESGALNEAFSDIFGTTIEFFAKPASANWLVGNEIGLTLRSMSNPNAYGDPDTYGGTNWYVGSADNGGVHTNSGVANFWYYLLVTGGTGTNDLGNAYTVTGVGMNNARLIAYRTLAYYLTPTSDYADARFYSIQAAIDLFGACTPQVIATTNAWYAVGVGTPYDGIVTADFAADAVSGCAAPLTVTFSNSSTNAGNFYWDFGDGSTSTQASPTHTYTGTGNYNVQLIADAMPCGKDTLIRTNYISILPTNPCTYNMLPQGNAGTVSPCNGTLYDAGGSANNYPDNVTSIITIAPPGAATVSLSFQTFDLEVDYDYIYLYDGTSDNAPNIGYYTGTTLPNGGNPIIASSGAMTIKLVADPFVNGAGFRAVWSCTNPTTAPVANFVSDVQTTCSGKVQFFDRSTNAPQTWLWNFGDGTTATAQNPLHEYNANGTYTVSLTADNSFGTNTVVKNNHIVVSRPIAPIASDDTVCVDQAALLTATGNGGGTLNWYDTNNGLLITGPTYNTPPLTATTNYSVTETITSPVQNVGPANSAIGTSANFGLSNRWLVFDVLTPVRLLSVKVYATGGFNRTIQLRNSAGQILQDTTLYINDGESRITLDFDLPIATGLQLGTAATSEMRRNSAGAVFPYTLPGILSITGTNAPAGYYYFFYDWQVQKPNCVSLEKNVVAFVKTTPAPPVVLGFSNSCEQALDQYSVDTPNPAYTYQWTVTGGTIVSGQGTPTINVLWNSPSGGSVAVSAINP